MVKLRVLGSGTSHGVPMIGCSCPICTSPDPRDKRTNASLLISLEEKAPAGGRTNILIDCGKDFRQQALREGIRRVDAVLLTHPHFDHIGGIDDLRVFNHLQPDGIPLYGKPEHLRYLRRYTYHYLFDPAVQRGGGITSLRLVPLTEPVEIAGIVFEPLPVLHGRLEIYGYRFLDCAYMSDVSAVDAGTLKRLEGLRHLFIDGLRFRPHVTHFSVDEVLRLVGRLQSPPRHTWLTHIAHDILHDEVEEGLQSRLSGYYGRYGGGEVHLAYDGLTLEIPGPPTQATQGGRGSAAPPGAP